MMEASVEVQSVSSSISRSVIALGGLLAIGLVLGAFVLGAQTKSIGSGRATVSVKGLAEKPVKADSAEWIVTVQALAPTFPQALAKLRLERIALDRFFEKQRFEKSNVRDNVETIEPHYVDREMNGRAIRVMEGYLGRQSITVNSNTLDKITAGYRAALDYVASGHDVTYAEPSYLVSGLEEVKMSLIGAATENARKRAEEFIKQSDAQLGGMRSASQGAFYIVPNTAGAKMDEYGGAYDKSTIDKVARVVVTVEYNLK
jgi:hypothetical protein